MQNCLVCPAVNCNQRRCIDKRKANHILLCGHCCIVATGTKVVRATQTDTSNAALRRLLDGKRHGLPSGYLTDHIFAVQQRRCRMLPNGSYFSMDFCQSLQNSPHIDWNSNDAVAGNSHQIRFHQTVCQCFRARPANACGLKYVKRYRAHLLFRSYCTQCIFSFLLTKIMVISCETTQYFMEAPLVNRPFTFLCYR